MKKMMMFAAIAATLVSCGGGGGRPTFGDNEYPVQTAGTSTADMQSTYPATIKGVQDVEIRPKVQGFLTQINVLDNETYQAQVRQAQAAVNTAQQQVNTAKLTYENSQQLHANRVIGDYELQTSQNSFESAKAQLAQAQANLASVKETLNFCYVKSPATGVVGTLPFKKGALVSASNVKMSGVIDQATGSVQLIASFPNAEKVLKSGGTGTIIIPHQNNNAIIIPQSCVSEVQNKKFIYLLGEGNKVKYSEIKVDPQNDGQTYVVTEGLKTGDKYVTNGITKLTDGMEIVPITPERYNQKIQEQAKEMTAGDIVNAVKK